MLVSLLAGLTVGLLTTKIVELIICNNTFLRQNFWDHPELIFNLHFHHSLIGLLLIIFSIIFYQKNRKQTIFILGLGMGIIIIHSLSHHGLIFIEK